MNHDALRAWEFGVGRGRSAPALVVLHHLATLADEAGCVHVVAPERLATLTCLPREWWEDGLRELQEPDADGRAIAPMPADGMGGAAGFSLGGYEEFARRLRGALARCETRRKWWEKKLSAESA